MKHIMAACMFLSYCVSIHSAQQNQEKVTRKEKERLATIADEVRGISNELSGIAQAASGANEKALKALSESYSKAADRIDHLVG